MASWSVLVSLIPEGLRPKLRAVGLVSAVGVVVMIGRGGSSGSAEAVLREALRQRGLELTQIVRIDRPFGAVTSAFGAVRYAVRAHEPNAPNDVYVAYVEQPREARALRMTSLYNLTRSFDADEQELVPSASGRHVAYPLPTDAGVRTVHILDFNGVTELPEHNTLQRIQARLTSLQNTGQPDDVKHMYCTLDRAVPAVGLAFDGEDILQIRPHAKVEASASDDAVFAVDLAKGAAIAGEGLAFTSDERARPPTLLPWAVDRARSLSFVGEEGMQWVKAFAFTGLGWFHEATAESIPSADETRDDESAQPAELPAPSAAQNDGSVALVTFPPKAIEPMLLPGLAGEGRWNVLTADPFMPVRAAGSAPAFAQSYVRTDKTRPVTRVTITLWDPRVVSLHMEAGTVEPLASTGQPGPGVIPRDPAVMERVVAGFNGGFQTVHGEYGMQVNKIAYLAPKPYAATVMELADGSTAFGTWPADSAAPEAVLSFRQNMTALVEHGTWNPWGRTWWGGTPPGWADNIHTTRSGLCLTVDGFVGYFYGVDVGPEALAEAMKRASCTYGMHLDMNPGLAGFEFYRVAKDTEWAPLGRPLHEGYEAEGTLPALPGYRFRARRMIPTMGHINFPQYIHRDTRDFFYLTLRDTLPGKPLAGVPFQAPLLGPRNAFESLAIVVAQLPSGAANEANSTHVTRIDPAFVTAKKPDANATVTTTIHSGREGTHSVVLTGTRFSVVEGASENAILRGSKTVTTASGVACIDQDGRLSVFELPKPSATKDEQLKGWLSEEGCRDTIYMQSARIELGAATPTSVPDEKPHTRRGSRHKGNDAPVPARREDDDIHVLYSKPGPHGVLLFDTPLVPKEVWQPLQAKRVHAAPKTP